MQVGPETDLSSRYAVVVSFGVLLNGTALGDIARRAGVDANSSAILDTLVRSAAAARTTDATPCIQSIALAFCVICPHCSVYITRNPVIQYSLTINSRFDACCVFPISTPLANLNSQSLL